MLINHSAPDFPAVGDGLCCWGATVYGPERCTCWRPVYTAEQQAPQLGSPSGAMPAMCSDCAFRPGSPERRNDSTVVADAEDLDTCVVTGRPFWCHDGMRRVVAWEHQPTGTRWTPPASEAAFEPPIVDGTPYRADGRPGDLCAGYVARRLHHLQKGVPS